jgi:glycosyltransferase involved in cell wall biosynthesis
LKILLLTQFFSSTRGGGEHLFYILAKKLAENNHQIWVITNKIEDESYPSQKNIKIVFVPPVLIYRGGLPPSIKNNFQYLINATRVGSKLIKENNIDVIHSNNFTPALAGNFIALLTSQTHITSIWDIFTLCGCDYWKKWVKQTKISKINQFIGPLFEKVVLKIKCDVFHTISEASKEDLLRFGAKKPIQVISPTIEEIPPQNVVQNNKQFICVGRLVFYKNVEILIKAIKIVKEKEKEVKLIIVGGGPYLETLQKTIDNLQLQNNIIIKGYVNAKEKTELIAQSNALLFPSLCEGFGLVILEAFQQKRPVLVSNIPPMSDIIRDENTGFILNSQNEQEWAEKIIHLINYPQNSISMGENGYLDLKENYNQEFFYKNIINMYNSAKQKN